MTTSTTSKLHVATEDDREGGGGGGGDAGKDSPSRRPKKGRVLLAGLLLVTVGGTPAFATPSVEGASARSQDTPAAERKVELRLDGRAAGRLLAETKESDGSGADDKSKADEKPGDKGDDGIKMTVTKGAPPAAKSTGSEDTFAFVKDWPFWAIVGGVVIVGASVYMINRNSSQDRNCPSVYNAGCFGAK
ncbi:MAG TPA: hypothetical protein VIU64_22760 [Polyangia bacterium]